MISSRLFNCTCLLKSASRSRGFANLSRDKVAAASGQWDVDALIKNDHLLVFNLYEKFQQSTAQNDQEKISNELIRQIAIHSFAEEVTVYPELRKLVSTQDVDMLFQEQQKVKEQLYQLDQMKIRDPRFKTLLATVMTELKDHTAKEETKELPLLRRNLSPERLHAIGVNFQAIKNKAPTRPHPTTPTSSPTLEALVGMLLTPFDKLRDSLRSFSRGDHH